MAQGWGVGRPHASESISTASGGGVWSVRRCGLAPLLPRPGAVLCLVVPRLHYAFSLFCHSPYALSSLSLAQSLAMNGPSRFSRLLAEVRRATDATSAYGDVRGLCLQLDYLRAIGAQPDLLHAWQFGRPLGATRAAPRRVRNHPSLLAHTEWAEREWDHLN